MKTSWKTKRNETKRERGNPGNKNESQIEIEMHGINFQTGPRA